MRYKIFSAPERSEEAKGEIVNMALEEKRFASAIEVLEIIKKEKGFDISEACLLYTSPERCMAPDFSGCLQYQYPETKLPGRGDLNGCSHYGRCGRRRL